MDKLFDGSDAHLLGANAEFIADLRERINPAYADQRGTESYERKLCADALEAADKRIAELERKLDVAREALKETTEVLEILRRGHGVDVGSKCYPAINIAREALAQIGGYDAR